MCKTQIRIFFFLCPRVQVSIRRGGRSTATCSRPISWDVLWFGSQVPRTYGRCWWASTRWWRWTGLRAPPRCLDQTLWPTALETSTARDGRSVYKHTHHRFGVWAQGSQTYTHLLDLFENLSVRKTKVKDGLFLVLMVWNKNQALGC